MDDLQRLVIEAACTRLIYDYCSCVDFGHASRIADLFTADGVWESPDVRREGADAIRAGLAPIELETDTIIRHVCTNVSIDVVSPDEARGLCYWMNFRTRRQPNGLGTSGVPKFTGEYHDRFVRTPDGWRFAHRRTTVAFSAFAGKG